ncbi:hypothetical protein QFC21_006977 [Naganishia friedmannii]|uniref:Uncharacterized protein n=1 Tax=Naganishia friedmannii TaxID=89922 RepID=A0ACC2V077_9TREE|nr:hypothetical protein QFC21_006977 [Naganishia friedmannii]
MKTSSVLSTLTFFAIAFLACVRASNVVTLTTDNFDQIIGQGKPALVEFYASWCGHCKKLVPVWEELADAFNKDKIIIAKIDADIEKEMGKRYGIQGFPTLKYFTADDLTNPQDYDGGRDVADLAAFITAKSGVRSKVKSAAPSSVKQLGAGNFEKEVVQGGKNVLVAFKAPWCGHCKSLTKPYEAVAKAFKSESDCVVAEVPDADSEVNRALAQKNGVNSYPTIKFFPKDGSEPIPYAGARNEEGFVTFLNEHCGTHRSPSGTLLATAGRALALDKLSAEFFSSPAADRPAVLSRARAYVANLTSHTAKQATGGHPNVPGTASALTAAAEYYIKAMERVLDKGESWLGKETARFTKLSASPSLAPAKMDEIAIKRNILSTFISRTFDDAAELAEDAVDAVRGVGERVRDVVGEATKSVHSVVDTATEAVGHKVKQVGKEEL